MLGGNKTNPWSVLRLRSVNLSRWARLRRSGDPACPPLSALTTLLWFLPSGECYAISAAQIGSKREEKDKRTYSEYCTHPLRRMRREHQQHIIDGAADGIGVFVVATLHAAAMIAGSSRMKYPVTTALYRKRRAGLWREKERRKYG